MRTFISLLMIILATFTLITNDAQAKRFGGGKSFGAQPASSSFSRAPQQSVSQSMANRASKWAGPLMGLAAGALIGSLLMGHGMGSAILSWLMIAVAVMFIFGLVRRFRQNGAQQQPAFNHLNNQQAGFDHPTHFQQQPLNAMPTNVLPNGFDSNTFLRDAKSLFIRLQMAYDKKDLNDLRKFTTPEVFAEIQLQLQERGETHNHTEVLSINNDLLNVSEEPQITIHGSVTVITASVRFTGSVREEANAAPVAINEIWHFQKDKMGSEWCVAGLQQN